MRALHADSPSWSLFGLTVATLLMVAWGAWFFLADLTLHETGQLARVMPSGTVVAAFPLEVADRIRSGQPAAFRLQQGMEPGPALPATVTKVSTPPLAKQLEVELYPKSRTAFTSLGPFLSQREDNAIRGQAAIEIARMTPATLLMRTLTASRYPNLALRPFARQ